MGYLALAKQVEAELKRRRQEGEISTSTPWPIRPCDDVNPALLEAEEMLFRLWWRTLSDKTMARQNWAAEIAYYGAQKGLSEAFLEALKTRVKDLR